MKSLKILDWPQNRFYSETHPFHRWSGQLKENGIKVEFYFDHTDKRLRDADYLIIHSRYFEDGWQNTIKRTVENEEELIGFLIGKKKTVGKLIWFDAADSTGSNDFPIIEFVDTFLKKQILKNTDYYSEGKNLRIWLDNNDFEKTLSAFKPCPKDQLYKIKVGWNIGLNDYRTYRYKLTKLSNYLSYKIYSNRFSAVNKERKYDLIFRGTTHNSSALAQAISFQRNKIINIFDTLNFNILRGNPVSKNIYWKELRNSKVSISPFGWGEICYRDFETLISGAVLIKPSMEHLQTYPNIYIPNETYIPVDWNLNDLEEKLEVLLNNYASFKHIAENAQELYKTNINNAELFVDCVKRMINY